MKKILLTLCLGLTASWLWAQSNPQVVTGANAKQDVQIENNGNNITFQVGSSLPFFHAKDSVTTEDNLNIFGRFPWDVLYIANTFSKETFEVSKGYYGDRIQIDWSLGEDNKEKIDVLEIYRRPYTGNTKFFEFIDGESVPHNSFGNAIKTLSTTDFEFADRYVDGAVIYEYMIYAKGISSIPELYTTYISGVGYRNPTAVVSGKVNFDGGNPVQDVVVRAEPQGGEISFGSSVKVPSQGNINVRYLNDDITTAATFQSWMRIEQTNNFDWLKLQKRDKAGVVSASNLIANVALEEVSGNKQLSFTISNEDTNGAKYKAVLKKFYPTGDVNGRGDDILQPISDIVNNFVHLSLVLKADELPKLLLNGRELSTDYIETTKVAQEKNEDVAARTIPEFKIEEENFKYPSDKAYNSLVIAENMNGIIDEIRLWASALDNKRVRQDFKRYLSGGETNLFMYLRANEGAGTALYDLSRIGYNFNKSDAVLNSCTWGIAATDRPTGNQLGILGVTDENGNYVIAAIPYSGTGESFNITPSYGVHQFDPNQQLIFLGAGAEVANKIDFTDTSSFTFIGKARMDVVGTFNPIENNGTINVPGIQQVNEAGYNSYKVTHTDGSERDYQRGDYEKGTEANTLVDMPNVGVENANIYIDGQIVLDKDNLPVKTNKDGSFKIKVPIGNHYIEVKKDKHNFTYGGRFPMTNSEAILQETRIKGRDLTEEEEEFINENHKSLFEFFENQEQSVTFLDTTKVTLVGKVVGGSVEASKPIGFGANGLLEHTFNQGTADENTVAVSAVNNIGQATIKLSHEAGEVLITTNPASGEYRRELAPVLYTIEKNDISTGITILKDTDEISGAFLSANEIVDLGTIPSVKKSEFLTSDIDTLFSPAYHFEKSFVYRSDANLYVVNQTSNDQISIGGVFYETAGAQLNGKSLPIYEQFKDYYIDFESYEVYKNYDDSSDVKEFQVPIIDGELNITNNLALEESGKYIINEEDESKIRYTFKGGLPTISKPFTKTISIKYKVNGKETEPANDFNNVGLILGGKSDGSQQFVTAAPDTPDIILRDPPGSNSFASIEEGQSFTFTSESSFAHSEGLTIAAEIKLGVEFEVGGGLAGPVIKSETTNSADVGITATTSSTNGSSLTKTYTFNQTISTSDEPDFVGAEADLYIGNSKNYFYGSYDDVRADLNLLTDSNGNSDALELVLKDADGNDKTIFISKQKAMYFVEEPSETFFIYSQKHILEALIPELELIVSNIDNGILDSNEPGVLTRKEYVDQINLWKKTILKNEITKYKALNDRDKLKASLDAEVAAQKAAIEEQISRSELPGKFFNSDKQLRQRLKDSDDLKNLLDERFYENISFDAGVGEFTKSSEFTSISTESVEYNFTLDESFSKKTGIKFNGAGIILETGISASQNATGGTSTETANNTVISYTLKDNDEGNFLSLDVVNAFDGNGPVFSTLGGRTSCPYEDEEVARFISSTSYDAYVVPFDNAMSTYNKFVKEINQFGTNVNRCRLLPEEDQEKCISFYFKPEERVKPVENFDVALFEGGAPLAFATQRVEDPRISVEVAELNNIPEDGVAEFKLILENNGVGTTAHTDFNLKIDTPSNPYGAIFNIKSGGGNIVNVPRGEKVPFILTMKKGLADQFEYKDIKLIFESICDDVNTGTSILLSATFVPSCSKVVVSKPDDNWVVNNADIYNLDGSTNTLNVELSEFKPDYNSFKKIDLQYRKATASSWNRLHTYYKAPFTTDQGDDVDYLATAIENGEDKNSSITETKLSYPFDIAGLDLSDGKYELRAISYCTDNTQFVSDVITGTVDLNKPQQFGTPSPTDGILNAGEDLRLQFSEPISYNSAISKIEIVAETNELPIDHAVSVYFNGPDNTMIIDKTSVFTGDYSIEFWMNNQTTGNAVIMQQENGFKLELINGELVWTLGGEQVAAAIANDDLFHHYTLTYHQGKGELRIYEDDKEAKVETVGSLEFTGKGALTIGGNSFVGNIHDLRMWTKSISLSESVANLYQQFVGSERNLVGYWKMNEGQGLIAKDLARYINATVNAAWDVKPKTTAYEFKNNQYLQLKLSDFAAFGAAKQIDDEMDVTLSFWVKTDKKAAAGLITNGRGTADDLLQSNGKRNKWAVELDDNGFLVFNNENQLYTLTESSIADNSWHHVAMVVKRTGGILKTYLDSKLVSSISAQNIGGISGSKFWIGARGYTNVGGTDIVDRHFTGKLDEIRLWNSSRTLDQIRRDSGYEIASTTLGLIMYANMNSPATTSADGPKYYHLLSNNKTPSVSAILSSGTPNYSDDAPKLKPKRKLLSFDVTHVINGDEIIVTPQVSDWAVLEGQILDITVDRLFDDAGNRQVSPVTWTAFVSRNNVKWYVNDNANVLTAEKTEGNSYQFDITLLNKGGKKENFEIKNIPNWLTLTEISGTLDPDSEKVIKATVDAELAVGEYVVDLYLDTDFGLDEKLQLNIRSLSESPNWSVNQADYSNSMNIIGKIKINSQFSNDEYTKVGAFVNGVARGEAFLTHDAAHDSYFVYLTVYSNVASGEVVSFKIWDALNDKVLTAKINNVLTTPFLQNEVLGLKSNPTIFSGTLSSEQIINLNKGWTWVSFFVSDQRFSSVKSTLDGLTLQDNDLVKSQSKFTRYENGDWNGSLTALEDSKMYKVKLANANALTLKGLDTDFANLNLSINEGWNWLPFPIHKNIRLQDALSLYDAKEGDLIKDQYSFAIYDATSGWSGSLNYMKSDRGYMIKSGTSQTLNYPNNITVAKTSSKQEQSRSNSISQFSKYSSNMSIVAEVLGSNSLTKVVVYDANGVLRGESPIVEYGDKKLSFVTVFSDTEDDLLQFRVSDGVNEFEIAAGFVFENNKVYGNMKTPVVLNLKSLGTEDLFLNNVVLYPNPFSNSITINSTQQSDKVAKIEIYSTIGVLVKKINTNSDKTIVDTANLATGIYLIKVTASSGKNIIKKMVKK